MLLSDPLTLAVTVLAVIVVGLAKGGFAGLGALATPLLALVLPPATADTAAADPDRAGCNQRVEFPP